MREKKKITAAVSAVMSYLQEEAAAASMQAASQNYIESPPTVPTLPTVLPSPTVPPSRPTRFWASGGRQAQMQMRNMMQLKAFHRLR